MNIFLIHTDPDQAADMLVDKLQNKMIVEGGQCLSSAIRLNGYEGEDIYKISYKNHPSIKSLVDNRELFLWLVSHTMRLCELYTQNTGKTHATQKIIERCFELYDYIPENDKTIYDTIPACNIFSYEPIDVVGKYQKFYLHDKVTFANWTKNNVKPEWFTKANFNLSQAWQLQEGRNKRVKNPISYDAFIEKCKELSLV